MMIMPTRIMTWTLFVSHCIFAVRSMDAVRLSEVDAKVAECDERVKKAGSGGYSWQCKLRLAGKHTLNLYGNLDAFLKNMEGVLTKYLENNPKDSLERIDNATLLKHIKAKRKDKFENLLLGTCVDYFVKSTMPSSADEALRIADSKIGSLGYSSEEMRRLEAKIAKKRVERKEAMEEQGRRLKAEWEEKIQELKQRLNTERLTPEERKNDTLQLNIYEKAQLHEEKEKIRRQKYDAAVRANLKPDDVLAG